ncbi:Xaa-Pro dipeptidase [Companilactobacillus allii]|uniref:Xaa-Pro dipeptidase n=2 Tax=Companilactobacillus allii TaxID=1847728 RepID=A0A1P8Q2Z1_9LACO|nr:Xaa-Pro peptidase family protein [Companilactobacillus allii]APX72186.1 Xaa-Pro dipeptidase [Companilactobacillus allii]
MMNETKIREYMEGENLDAFFIAKRVNIRFASGWTGDDSYILLTKNQQFFLTDPRYIEQAEIELPDYEIINWRLPDKTVGDSIAELTDKYKIKTIAFEDDYLTYDMYADFNKKVKATLFQAGQIIDAMRVVKSPEEIAYLRISCEIACRAFNRIVKDIRVGVTEKELAAKLSLYMVEEGADTQPYGNILISGKTTSLLHGIPSSKAVEYGDFVLMDYGCQYHGYMSDMTRTVVVGKPTAKQKEVYEYAKRSLEASEAVIKAGISTKIVYPASLEPLKGTEYTKLTYDKIGHSIGLFVHEYPYLAETFDDIIETGTVLTVEPGIYIPNWGGVRIEDQILVTDDGYENMISVPHDLIEL